MTGLTLFAFTAAALALSSAALARAQYDVFDLGASSDLTLELLPDGLKHGAVCLDGSPPGYWYRKGYGEGAKKCNISATFPSRFFSVWFPLN